MSAVSPVLFGKSVGGCTMASSTYMDSGCPSATGLHVSSVSGDAAGASSGLVRTAVDPSVGGSVGVALSGRSFGIVQRYLNEPAISLPAARDPSARRRRDRPVSTCFSRFIGTTVMAFR